MEHKESLYSAGFDIVNETHDYLTQEEINKLKNEKCYQTFKEFIEEMFGNLNEKTEEQRIKDFYEEYFIPYEKQT